MSVSAFYALPDEERDYWIADWEIKRNTCPDCGNPLEDCSDPKRTWYPYRRICYATMERDAAAEAYNALHSELSWHDGTHQNWAKERSSAYPFPATAGMSIGVAGRDLIPWDEFTTKVSASPEKSSREAEDHEQPTEADDGRQAGEGHRVPEAALTESEGDH